MFDQSQHQKAGDNSFQLCIGSNTPNITNITNINQTQTVPTELVRDVCNSVSSSYLNVFTEIAKQQINERIDQFRDNYFIPRIKCLENAVSALKDPGFQNLLSLAQKSAALNDHADGCNEEILADLLASKVENISAKDKAKNIALKKAIEAMEFLDHTDITALNILSCVWLFKFKSIPLSIDNIKIYAEYLNLVFEYFVDHLPSSKEWINNLILLNLIEDKPLSKLMKFDDILARHLPKLFSAGIKTDTSDYQKAINILNDAKFLSCFLVDNPYIDNHKIIPIFYDNQIDQITVTFTPNDGSMEITKLLSEKEKQVLRKILDLYSNNQNDNNLVKNKIINYLCQFKNLELVKDWFNSIEQGIKLTSAGLAIVNANFNRVLI